MRGVLSQGCLSIDVGVRRCWQSRTVKVTEQQVITPLEVPPIMSFGEVGIGKVGFSEVGFGKVGFSKIGFGECVGACVGGLLHG